MRKISYKLGLMQISLFIILMVTIGHVFDTIYVHFYVDHIENELYFRGLSHANVLAEYFNQQTLHHVAMMEGGVETAVVVVNAKGNVLISSNCVIADQKKYLKPITAIHSTKKFEETDWKTHPYIVTKSPIIKKDEIVGTVIMFSSTIPIRQEVNEIHLAITIFAISAIMISSFIILLFSKQITQPLIKIRKVSQQIAKGNYCVQLPLKGNDEITDLTTAINSMASELHRYETSRNEFLSNISHELKTPLMYIKGYADLLIQDRIRDPEERINYLTIISEETLRVQHLVKDLFDLTKYRDGKILLTKKKINMVTFINEIVYRAQYEMERKGITCQFNSNIDEISGMIDPERLEQVLMNLLENARVYTAENGEITVSVCEGSTSITIKIEDNGIGIPEEELSRIWERFYRVEKSRSRNYGGTGLGLPIAKEIIELHGGHIEVSSVENQGTVFSIHLPI
ncbi:MAG: ATP-binding protein [Bacillota bacterium]|nr:ATP-binding protein [Bacillota bacterium]